LLFTFIGRSAFILICLFIISVLYRQWWINWVCFPEKCFVSSMLLSAIFKATLLAFMSFEIFTQTLLQAMLTHAPFVPIHLLFISYPSFPY
jgi:hypothetical protein